MALVVAAAFAALPAAAAAASSAGALDPSFGDGGRVLLANPEDGVPTEFNVAAREPNGNIALEVTQSRNTPPYVQREIELRTPGGAPVSSFGTDGRLSVEGGAGLVALANGDLAIGVERCGAAGGSSVIVLEPNGAPVPGFGAGGCGPKVEFQIERLAPDAQGRLLVIGSRQYCGPCGHDIVPNTEVVVERLLPDGSVDASYGTNGSIGVRNGDVPKIEEFYGGLRPDAAVVTPDGGLVVATEAGLFRLGPSGAIDKSFGNGGGVTSPGNGVGALALLTDGSLAAVSTTYQETVLVTKVAPGGAPDPGFGDAGTKVLPFKSQSGRVAVAAAPGGAVLVAAEPAPATPCRRPCTEIPTVLHLTPAGQVDPSYGNAGAAAVRLPAPMLPQPDKLTGLLSAVDGSTLLYGSDEGQDAFVSAIDPAGAPERAFGSDGNLIEHLEQPAQLGPQGLMLTPDGHLTVSAWRSTESGRLPDFLVEVDEAGKQLPQSGGGARTTLARGTILPDGAGRAVSWDGKNERHVLRAAGPPGSLLDPGWGDHGTYKIPSDLAPEAIDPAPGGGILVVGTFAKNKMGILRLGPTGHPVRDFGNRGLVKLTFPKAAATACAALVERDGKIVITGWVNGHVGAARLLPDGRLDRGYGNHGLVRVRLGKGVYGELIAPWKGGVVIAASRYISPRAHSAGLIRLDRHGRVDRHFGRHGVVRAFPEIAPFALFTGADRIVTVTNPEWEPGHHGGGVELRSYRPDGGPDRAFGHAGVRFFGGTTKNGALRLDPSAAVQQPDGKVVVVGEGRRSGTPGSQAELARFLVR